MGRLFVNAVNLSHKVVAEVISQGDVVIDATVGNGNDTVFLAGLVGSQGHVFGFDTQQAALDRAREKLINTQLLPRVTLFNAGHEQLSMHVTESIKACMFNLGYLPGSEHRVVTQPQTTVSAIRQAMDLLLSKGIISIVVYTGHQGGPEEAAAVAAMIESLPQELWDVAAITFPNRRNDSPYLVTIQRR